MKRILAIWIWISCAMAVFAQSYDEETGIRLYKNRQYEAAVPYLQKAAKAGSSKAQDFLGYMYERGLGVDKNYQIAMNLYKKADAAGYGPGMVSIGRLYENGFGVDKSPEKAFSYYKKAATIGCAEGEYQLGLCYYYGYGTSQDYSQALEYLKRSSTGGYAYEKLGDMYYFGEGTLQNYEEAKAWYTKEKPAYYSEGARMRLAVIYQRLGRVRNYSAAIEVLKGLNTYAADSLTNVLVAAKEEAERAARVVRAPQYPGGSQAIVAFLRKNMRKPSIAIEVAGNGTTTIEFIIDTDGTLKNPVYTRRCNVRVDEEVMRLTKMLRGWSPATKGGFPCRSLCRLSMSIFPSFNAKVEFVRVLR